MLDHPLRLELPALHRKDAAPHRSRLLLAPAATCSPDYRSGVSACAPTSRGAPRASNVEASAATQWAARAAKRSSGTGTGNTAGSSSAGAAGSNATPTMGGNPGFAGRGGSSPTPPTTGGSSGSAGQGGSSPPAVAGSVGTAGRGGGGSPPATAGGPGTAGPGGSSPPATGGGPQPPGTGGSRRKSRRSPSRRHVRVSDAHDSLPVLPSPPVLQGVSDDVRPRGNPAFAAYATCFRACMDNDCRDRCVTDNPAGIMVLRALRQW